MGKLCYYIQQNVILGTVWACIPPPMVTNEAACRENSIAVPIAVPYPETIAMMNPLDTNESMTIQEDEGMTIQVDENDDNDNDDNDNDDDDDDDALMTMDFPIAGSTITPLEIKPLKPTSDTTWNDNALLQCLELSLIAYCNHDENIKEWKAPTPNDTPWMPAKLQIPMWLKNPDPK